MFITEKTQKCQHGPCKCMVLPGQRYCSKYCEEEFLLGHKEPGCQCGHAEETASSESRKGKAKPAGGKSHPSPAPAVTQ